MDLTNEQLIAIWNEINNTRNNDGLECTDIVMIISNSDPCLVKFTNVDGQIVAELIEFDN